MSEKPKSREIKVGVSVKVELPGELKGDLEEIKKKFRAILLEKVDAIREGDKLIVEEAEEPEEYEIDY